MKFLVFRQDGFRLGPFMVVTAVVRPSAISTDAELVAELKSRVTAWVRGTEEGKKAWEESSGDLNIGDLSAYDLTPILKDCPNIVSLDWEQVEQAENWNYDTVLADDPDEE